MAILKNILDMKMMSHLLVTGIEHYAILMVMTYGLARMHKVPKGVAKFKIHSVQISALIFINKGSSFHRSTVSFDRFNT